MDSHWDKSVLSQKMYDNMLKNNKYINIIASLSTKTLWQQLIKSQMYADFSPKPGGEWVAMF